MECELIEDAGLGLMMLAGIVVVQVELERIIERIKIYLWIIEVSKAV
jgi:hypothetical protein